MDGSVAVAVVFMIIVLVLLFVIIPFVGTRPGRFAIAAGAALILWAMITFVPLADWTAWVMWVQANWWAGLVAVALLLMGAVMKGK